MVWPALASGYCCRKAAASGWQTGDGLKERLAALAQNVPHGSRQHLLRHSGREPHIGTEDGAYAEEALGGDSDNGERSSIDVEDFADDLRSAIETDFPGVVAEHSNGRGTRRADLLWKEEPTLRGRDAEGSEIALRDKLSEETLGASVFGQRHDHRRREAAEIGEDRVPGLIVLEIRIRDGEQTAGLGVGFEVRRIEADQAGRIAHRKRMQKQRVDHREDGGAGADAQS